MFIPEETSRVSRASSNLIALMLRYVQHISPPKMILEPVLKLIPMVQTASKGPDSGALFENRIPNNRIPWPTDSSIIDVLSKNLPNLRGKLDIFFS